MLFTEILLALQRGISRLPNLQAFHHIGGPRRGPGGERKAPWSPPQRRNPLRYGARKEGLSPAFHKKPIFCDKPYPLQEEGAEGFQRATGKPFGRLRRGETLCETGKSKEGLSPAFHKNPSFCEKPYPPQAVGAEGFQRASGKPFGRLRRGETFCDTGKVRIGSFPCLAQEIYFLWQVPCAAGGPKVSKGRPESPLVASAEAKPFVIREK